MVHPRTIPTMGAVIQLPDTAPSERRIDAGRVFGHYIRPGHRGWLWTVTVDGTEYLTDRYVTIRADRLAGIDDQDLYELKFPPANVARVLEALAAPLAGLPATARFDVAVIAGLHAAGAGILPLAGVREPNVHAVMFCGDRIGLVTPIPAWRADHALGAIPGVPPGPTDTAWIEATR